MKQTNKHTYRLYINKQTTYKLYKQTNIQITYKQTNNIKTTQPNKQTYR